jgi:hypothetical protein
MLLIYFDSNYSLKYNSKLDFLFEPSHGKRKDPKATQFIDSLPHVLKHTLLLDTKIMTKMREIRDVG